MTVLLVCGGVLFAGAVTCTAWFALRLLDDVLDESERDLEYEAYLEDLRRGVSWCEAWARQLEAIRSLPEVPVGQSWWS